VLVAVDRWFTLVIFYSCLLGKLYLNGEGVEKDEEKAITYFMKGVEKS